MILLNDVVEVFDLTDLNESVTALVMTPYHRRIGTTLVDRDLIWRAVVLDRLAKEARRGLSIPFGRQRKSTVAPALSTARYRYFQTPFAFT